MTFISVEFLILFIVTALLFWRCKTERQRQWILLLSSYVFYAYWDIRFWGLLLLQTFISYILAKKIEQTSDVIFKKKYCVIGVICSLSILAFFKYFNFFLESAQAVLGFSKGSPLQIILPVGISFYTFQAMSYLIDVYRNKVTARKDFFTISLYISFFPQLVAGPIVKAEDFLKECEREHYIKWSNVEKAITIFLFGLTKKVVIADRLAVCVDAVFKAPEAYNTASIACAVIAYSIQIYCDFSGYSDMAIGLAKFFDFDLCRNFNMPYISKNPTEFWKRWHISLSTWLKEYLYISLGGNRLGTCRTYMNLLLTMVLGGLWHGASWNFVIWGTLHGVALIIHKMFLKIKKEHGWYLKNKFVKVFTDAVSIIATYLFACVCWVFFRASDFETAFIILQRLFIWHGGLNYIFSFTILYAWVILAAHVYGLCSKKGEGVYPVITLNTLLNRIVLCLWIWIIVIFSYNGDNAFIYFQF